MACPFSKVARRKPLTARGLRRLPPRAIPGLQPAAVDHPFYRQPAFANIVHAVYASILREIKTKGEASRFIKAERGKFALAKSAA
jgi:hypothetical protein